MPQFKLLLIIFIIIINLLSFITVAYDKRQAKHHRWRVPESRFFFLAILGGAIGVYLGMNFFRHKTKHTLFIYGIPSILLLNLLMFYLLFIK